MRRRRSMLRPRNGTARALAVARALGAAVLLAIAAPSLGALPPAPDLSSVAPSVRAAIEEEIRRLAGLLQGTEDPQRLREAWLSLGDSLFVHEFNAEARAAYEAAASSGEGDPAIAYRLGMVAMNDGRVDDAIPAFNQAVTAADAALETAARVRRGRAYLDQGDWQSARVDFAAALAIDPESPAALGGAGQAALAAGEPQEAVRQITRALELDPGASRLYQPLGLAYRELGERDRARAALQQVGDGEPALDDPVLDAVRMKSRNPQFWLQSGLGLADRGDFAAAAELIGRAVALAPEDLALLGSYGRVLAHAGNFELAEKALERAVTGPDAGAEDWLYLGRVRQGLGRLDAAREAYAAALELEPEDAQAREALARLDLHEGRGEVAATAFAQLGLRATAPRERARYGYWQAIALLAADDCGGAAAAVKSAMAADSPVAPEVLQLAARLRATCDDSLGASLEETVGWAELAYERQPGLSSAETLAMSYAAAGRWQDAEDLQAQAIFEALKRRELDARPALQGNMQRYRQREPAVEPFADGDPVFSLDSSQGAPR